MVNHHSSSSPWPHRLAVLTAATTVVLIFVGGLVTNTGSALAVPDWPTTFGHTMFVYPWSQMVGGIFYEHSHRLIGSVVGLLTLALAGALWRQGGRLRALGMVLVAAVVIQGVLGGLRVVLLKDTLAIVHGCLAQAFFGLAVAVAVLTSARHQTALRDIDSTTRTLTVVAAALVYAQIVFGALLTHAGWIVLHLAGAAAVLVSVPLVTARRHRSGRAHQAARGAHGARHDAGRLLRRAARRRGLGARAPSRGGHDAGRGRHARVEPVHRARRRCPHDPHAPAAAA